MIDALAGTAIGLSVLALLHTYVGYPLYLRYRAGRLPPQVPPPQPADWPHVSVLIAAYNEERVILEKLRTVFALDYPPARLHVYVGSDCSTDGTNGLVAELARQQPALHFYPYRKRRGKPGVLNALAASAFAHRAASPDHYLLLTDANVLLDESTLKNLARHLHADPGLALVDSHLVHTPAAGRGVGESERTYIGREVRIKHREGRLWQRMIGPFGGCYLLRSDFFEPIPPTALVDDFYLAMRAFERGGGAINDPSALSYEAVGDSMREEFRRKARISTGNVQNLLRFRRLWWPPTLPLGFAFFSHKILRWLGPLWLLGLLLGGAVLGVRHPAPGGWVAALLAVLFVGLPLADWALQWLGIRLQPLRAWRYFLLMNVALGVGWWRYATGEQRGIWTPPARG